MRLLLKLFSGKNWQGQAFSMDKKRYGFRTEGRQRRMAEVLSRRQDDLTLVLANIHDPHNVSAIYRTCDAFGVSRAHLYYTSTPFPQLGEKSSASARKWVESIRHRDRKELADCLRRGNFRIIATSFSERARPLWDWDFLGPCAIILGNEHSGVDPEILEIAQGELYIPMFGMIQSFNVSVAAAIILAEAARQRNCAGLYAKSRLAPADFEARLAAWLEK